MRRATQGFYGFPESSIKLLLNADATAQNIEESFQSWLIDSTGPGDRVFFSYAGHGSQLEDDNGDEEDGFDETLAPYDVDPMSGANQIRDHPIAAPVPLSYRNNFHTGICHYQHASGNNKVN